MVESLRRLGDFVVDLKWDFSSWIPLVSRMLPSDICKISKKGEKEKGEEVLISLFIHDNDKSDHISIVHI